MAVRIGHMLFATMMWLAGFAAAAQSEPTISPQWSAWLSRDRVAQEPSTSMNDAMWDVGIDGTLWMATSPYYAYPSSTMIRALAPDGTVRLRRVLDPDLGGLIALRADPATGGVFLSLAVPNAGWGCRLAHLDAAGIVDWQTTAQLSDGGSPCGLHTVLSDGTLLLLRMGQVTAVAPGGAAAWRYAGVVAEDLAISPSGDIWVVGSAAGGGSKALAVARIGLDGVERSRDEWTCDCPGARARAVAVDASGAAVVAGYRYEGTSGGLIARYAPNGLRTAIVATPRIESLEDLVIDGAGALYAKGGFRVARLAPDTGAIAWEAAATGVLPADSGVFIAASEGYGSTGQARIARRDPAGNVVWTRLLDEPRAGAIGLRRVGDTMTVLTRVQRTPMPTTCGSLPVAQAFDAAGNLSHRREPCLEPSAEFAQDLATSDRGALVVMPYETRFFDPAGQPRWSIVNCQWCLSYDTGNRRTIGGGLVPDGGAFLLHATRGPDYRDALTLSRVNALGVVTREVALPQLVAPRLLVHRDGRAFVVGFATAPTRVAVLRIADAGNVAWQRLTTVPTFGDDWDEPWVGALELRGQHLVASLGVSAGSICTIGCPPAWSLLIGFDAELGTARWREEWYGEWGYPQYAVPDRLGGGASLAYDDRGRTRIARWRNDGTPLPDVPLAPFPAVGAAIGAPDVAATRAANAHVSGARPNELTGPLHDRWVVYSYRLVAVYDTAGRLMAYRTLDPSAYVMHIGESGIIVAEPEGQFFAVRVLDLADLAPRARLVADIESGVAGALGSSPAWHLDDREAYTLSPFRFETIGRGARLLRFSVPPPNLLFADGVE